MKKRGGTAMPLLDFTVAIVWVGSAQAGPLEDLIAGAKKEGAIEFYGPSTLTPQGAQALAATFNKKYGLNISLKYSPSGNMVADVSKVVGIAAEGRGPHGEW